MTGAQRQHWLPAGRPPGHAGAQARTLLPQRLALLQEAAEGRQAGARAHHHQRRARLPRQPEGAAPHPHLRAAGPRRPSAPPQRTTPAASTHCSERRAQLTAQHCEAWQTGRQQPSAQPHAYGQGAAAPTRRQKPKSCFGRIMIQRTLGRTGTRAPTSQRLKKCEQMPAWRRPVGVASSTTAQVMCTAAGCASGEDEME